MTEIMQYLEGNSLLHRLNPLTKLIFMVGVVGLSLLSTDLLMLAGMAVALLVLSFVSGLHRELLRQIPILVSLTAGLLLLTLLTMQSGPVIFEIIPGILPVTEGALLFASVLSLRFVVMIFTFQMVIITTKPGALVQTLRRLHMPVDYTLMLLIALRFIPSLQIEGKRIHEAQLARAYDPGRGISGSLRSLTPLMVPLVSNALGRANVLGLTIDLRGYRNGNLTEAPPTGRLDKVAICAILTGVILLAAICII